MNHPVLDDIVARLNLGYLDQNVQLQRCAGYLKVPSYSF
jgi:hypothetical protein